MPIRKYNTKSLKTGYKYHLSSNVKFSTSQDISEVALSFITTKGSFSVTLLLSPSSGLDIWGGCVCSPAGTFGGKALGRFSSTFPVCMWKAGVTQVPQGHRSPAKCHIHTSLSNKAIRNACPPPTNSDTLIGRDLAHACLLFFRVYYIHLNSAKKGEQKIRLKCCLPKQPDWPKIYKIPLLM